MKAKVAVLNRPTGMVVYLGPCPCQGCGEALWWASRSTRYLGNTIQKVAWRHGDGTLHRCPASIAEVVDDLENARSMYNGIAEYSGPIAHNAQRPSVRLYSEREGVGYSGVQTE